MKILFVGDSITDSCRNYDDPKDLGNGFPKWVAQYLREEYPEEEFEFKNIAVGGYQTKDVLKDWEGFCGDFKPDIATILMGVNDTWHHVEDQVFKTPEQFNSNYSTVCKQIKDKFGCKLVVIGQYILPNPTTDPFHYDFDQKLLETRKVAREYADRYIPMDGLFASACIFEEPTYWAADGVHPTDEGHQYIASYVTDAICDLIDEDIDED